MRGKNSELMGRKHFSSQVFKELSRVDNGERGKFIMLTELKTMRDYVNAIPTDLKDEITERKKAERKRTMTEKNR